MATADDRRGSRKHVLDWTSRPEFPNELLEMLQPLEVSLPPDAMWMPGGHASPVEARLETFGPRALPEYAVWDELQSWWLAHRVGANTPNWDLAATATIEGRKGLILVEAKANVPELGEAGKSLGDKASERSSANHVRIGQAIAEAQAALSTVIEGVNISRGSHYQLANRVAFMWKLASLGIPTVLVYLGFTGDEGIRDAGEPFRDDAHWRSAFASYSGGLIPLATMAEVRLPLEGAPAWLLVRSRVAGSASPPRHK